MEPVSHPAPRWTIGRVQHPVRGMLHGTAALAAVAAGLWLVASSPPGPARRVGLVVFAVTMTATFVVSTLYHTVGWREVWKDRMLRVDNGAIFAFIAGTYTPIALIVLDGWLTWATLAVAWGIALAGIVQLTFFPRRTTGASLVGYVVQGWLAVALLVPLAQRLPWTALLVAFAGGLLYTAGLVVVVAQRPRLWPRVFSYHEVFHVLAIVGAAAHFTVVARWVAPFAGAG